MTRGLTTPRLRCIRTVSFEKGLSPEELQVAFVCERALLGTIHNGGSRAAPAHGFRITALRSA
jgi:hypothetical protein